MNNFPNNQATNGIKSSRRSDKIATYIARGFSCCIGIALLITFFILLIKGMSINFENVMLFGAMIGLCLGYGLGGDIWGLRLFGLFTHFNFRRRLGQNGKPSNYYVRFFSNALLFFLVGILVLILALISRELVQSLRTTP